MGISNLIENIETTKKNAKKEVNVLPFKEGINKAYRRSGAAESSLAL